MTDKQPEALHYADRDSMALGDYYFRHVSAMTNEALHAKSAIAAELAHRDREIDNLRAELETLRAGHDAARLDFLVKHQAYVVSDDTCCDGYWLRFPAADGTTSVQIGEYETPRAAIDAARAAQEGK